MPVAGLHIHGGDQPVPGHPPGDAKHPILVLLDVLAGHQPQQLGGFAQRPVQLATIQGAQRGRASRTSASTSASRAFGSSQSHGGLPSVA